MHDSDPKPPRRRAALPALTTHELLRHREWIRALAERLVVDPGTAEDLAQETLALGLRNPGGVPGLAWLAGVVRNLALQRNRVDARRARREKQAASHAPARSAAALVVEVESHRLLVDHVLALDEAYRDVLVKRYFGGLKPAAIAHEEGCSVASVGNRLTRAHAALRRRLEADGGESEWMRALTPLLAAPMATKTPAAALAALLLSPWAIATAAAGILALVWMLRTPGPQQIAPPPVGFAIERQGERAEEAEDSAGDQVARVENTDERRIGPPANSATLTATISDGRGRAVPDALVELVRDGTGLSAASTDESGGITLTNLPTGVELAVHVTAGNHAWPEPIDRLVLQGGEDRATNWTIHLRTLVCGTAIDEDGAPLPGQIVHWIRPWRSEPSLGCEYEESAYLESTVTDVDGRFVFSPVEPGAYHALSTARGSDVMHHRLNAKGEVERTPAEGRLRSQRVVARIATLVQVPIGQAKIDIQVLFVTGGQIEGSAEATTTGEVIPGTAHLQVTSVDGSGLVPFASADDGTFRSPPLPRGEYAIQGVRGPAGWHPKGKLTVRSGSAGVSIPFSPAAEVTIRIDNAADVQPSDGWLDLIPAGKDAAWDAKRRHAISATTTYVNESTIPPGRYGVVATSKDGRAMGVVKPLELGAGPLPGGLVVPMEPTASISIENKSADTPVVAIARIHGLQYALGTAKPGDAATIHAPRGTTELELLRGGRRREAPTMHTVSLQPGEQAVVRWE